MHEKCCYSARIVNLFCGKSIQVRRRQRSRTVCFQIIGQSSEVSCSKPDRKIKSNISTAHVCLGFL